MKGRERPGTIAKGFLLSTSLFLKMFKLNTMTYPEFAKQKPVLYGMIRKNGKIKIGSFKSEWQAISNSVIYRYHTPEGNPGKGGFTLYRAYSLLTHGNLSTNPSDGDPKNYL